MELSPTATVILGFLSDREMSGYDIKSEVDLSTRFFWAASYGQIYPELKRLTREGLVEPVDGPEGERRRTAYRITTQGTRALENWLLAETETLELRHEGLLKLFFSDALPQTDRRRMLEGIADQHREKLAALEQVEASRPPDREGGSREVVLRFGIEFQHWVIDWCMREMGKDGSDAGEVARGV
jgi:PadR family transcriptional regulator, regulatory protein AphA